MLRKVNQLSKVDFSVKKTAILHKANVSLENILHCFPVSLVLFNPDSLEKHACGEISVKRFCLLQVSRHFQSEMSSKTRMRKQMNTNLATFHYVG